MLSEEDKRRIEAEEAYRAKLRGGKAASQLKIGIRREAGSALFRLAFTVIVLVLGLAACAIIH